MSESGTPSAGLTIRPARLDDAAAIEAVFNASYPALMAGAYDAALLTRALPRITRAHPALLAGGTYFVAEDEGEPVGCGGWSRERPGTGAIEPGLGHIRHFATRPTFVGRGVGRALYGRCVSQAQAAGVQRFECYSSLNGEPFYAALGFARLGLIEVAMGPDLAFPSMMMMRWIASP